jgi:hypothetical protein
MRRSSLTALAASLLFLCALGAQAAIVDGSSNTILLPEVPTDRCIVSPASCEEPPVAEPPAPSFSHEVVGSARLKGDGFKVSQPYVLQIHFDTSARTFLAMDGDGTLYSGRLAPKGKKGDRFKVFMDDGTDDAFAADVAARGAAAAGRTAGSVLGKSSQIVLKLGPNGSASLRIKSDVLVTGIGEVGFKANLSSDPPL